MVYFFTQIKAKGQTKFVQKGQFGTNQCQGSRDRRHPICPIFFLFWSESLGFSYFPVSRALMLAAEKKSNIVDAVNACADAGAKLSHCQVGVRHHVEYAVEAFQAVCTTTLAFYFLCLKILRCWSSIALDPASEPHLIFVLAIKSSQNKASFFHSSILK